MTDSGYRRHKCVIGQIQASTVMENKKIDRHMAVA
jgi:hypothetical protein